jgi:translocation and assembly module TamB
VTIDTVGLAEQPPELEREKPLYPIELPDVALPLTVIIDSVRIGGIKMVNDPNTDPLRIGTIALKAQWDDQGLEIQRLGLVMPELEFEADGRLTPVGDYPLEIHTLLRLAHGSLIKGRLQGAIEGDKNRIDITKRFDGDAQFDATTTLTQPLQNLGWDGILTLKEIPGRLINSKFPAQLKGKITVRGDLKTAQLDGHLLVASQSDPTIDLKSEFAFTADLKKPSVLIRKLQAVHQTLPMWVSLSGSASLEDKSFALQGDWQDLQWPLTADPIASSHKGGLSAKGSIEDYQFEISAGLSGKDIPKGQWAINGQGNDQRLNRVEIVGQLLEGVLKTLGEGSWVPAVSYEFTAKAEHINPGVQYPEWQGEIDMESKVIGKLTETGPIVNVVLSALTGELRGLPIRGRCAVDVNPEVIDVDGLVIGSGRAEVRTNGKLGQRSDLSWELDIPEASDLIPEAVGRLTGKGTVRGPQTHPLVNAQLAVESFHAGQWVADRLAADLDVDLSYRKKSTISLVGQGLSTGGQQISQLSINAEGTLDIHGLEMVVSHELGQVRLALQGGSRMSFGGGRYRIFVTV